MSAHGVIRHGKWNISVIPPWQTEHFWPAPGGSQGGAAVLVRDIKITNNKFLKNHLDNFLIQKLLFLYLINEVAFGSDILQDYVSSYNLHTF
jgi:hypothetical protein